MPSTNVLETYTNTPVDCVDNMLVYMIFGIIALRLAEAIPMEHAVQALHARATAIPSPKILAANSQFDFAPYELSDACFDCTRQDSNSLFECHIKCMCTRYRPKRRELL